MRTMFIALILAICINSMLSSTPPVWPDTFSQSYVISDSTTTIHSTGKLWYDFKNNRQRIDIQNSWFDYVCNVISSKSNTTCIKMNTNNYLYYWLPDQNKCCKCCAAQVGCTVKPKDWLKSYTYAGTAVLSGQTFDKWKIPNPRINESYYVTMDQRRIPRRQQSGTLAYDYIMNTYSQNEIPSSIFNLPDYCEQKCPSGTFCAQII